MGSEDDSDSDYEDNSGRPHQHDYSKADSQPTTRKRTVRGTPQSLASESDERPPLPPVFNADLFHQAGSWPPFLPLFLSLELIHIIDPLSLFSQILGLPHLPTLLFLHPRPRPPFPQTLPLLCPRGSSDSDEMK